MKSRQFYFLIVSTLILGACAIDTTTENYPDTPEAVVRAYQDHLDKNEFEEVKKYSTKKEQDRIDEIAPIILEEIADSTIFITTFINIDCMETEKQAICDCLIENFDEQYTDVFVMILVNGQWKVDAPEDEINYDHNEEIEQFIQEELMREEEGMKDNIVKEEG